MLSEWNSFSNRFNLIIWLLVMYLKSNIAWCDQYYTTNKLLYFYWLYIIFLSLFLSSLETCLNINLKSQGNSFLLQGLLSEKLSWPQKYCVWSSQDINLQSLLLHLEWLPQKTTGLKATLSGFVSFIYITIFKLFSIVIRAVFVVN